MGKTGMQPILLVTVSVRKIKGVDRQHYAGSDGDARCEQALNPKQEPLLCTFVKKKKGFRRSIAAIDRIITEY